MTESATTAMTSASPAGRTGGRVLLRVLRRPAGLVSVSWLVLITAASIGASVVAPYTPLAQDLANSYAGPSTEHLLGTDKLGRDVLSRTMYGGRVSLFSVLQAVTPFVLVGVSVGLIAGYVGGRLDRLLMRTCDVIMAIPLVITVLIVLAVFNRNQAAAMVTFGLLASAGLVRIVRAVTLTVRNDDYVMAARVAGLSGPQVVRRHLLPRVVAPVLIQSAILGASALLVESGLNYLGLGVQPPTPSWGGLVADASNAINRHPWLLAPTGAVIVLTALAFAVVGDVARDVVADRSDLAPRSWRDLLTVARPTSSARGLPAEPPSEESSPQGLVSVRGLEVNTGGTALVRGVDLTLARGEVLGVVGESGCGKTLTISALLRLLPAGVVMEAKEYRLAAHDILALSERETAALRGAEIAFIPQEPVAGLDPSFKIRSQLGGLVRHHRGLKGAAATAYLIDLLGTVRLRDPERVLASYPHELSGGMAQRVAIARALIGDPQLLVADEPTTALDVTVQAEILQLLRSLRNERGLSVIIVTHDWGVVADICDRAMVMYAGEVVEQGPVRDLFHRPRHPYSVALLAANPSAAAFREELESIPGRVPPPFERPDHCAFAARCTAVTPECLEGPVPLVTVDSGHAHRCLNPVLDHAKERDSVATS